MNIFPHYWSQSNNTVFAFKVALNSTRCIHSPREKCTGCDVQHMFKLTKSYLLRSPSRKKVKPLMHYSSSDFSFSIFFEILPFAKPLFVLSPFSSIGHPLQFFD